LEVLSKLNFRKINFLIVKIHYKNKLYFILFFKGKSLKASLSNFGNIPYGYNIVGKVYFNPDNLDDEMACKNITGIHIDNNQNVDEVPVVMIDR